MAVTESAGALTWDTTLNMPSIFHDAVLTNRASDPDSFGHPVMLVIDEAALVKKNKGKKIASNRLPPT